MAQSARIDYFRATTTDPELIKGQLGGYFNEKDTEQVKIPLYGYRLTLQHRISSAFYCANPHTAAMGNMVQFSGSPITSLMADSGNASIQAILATGCGDWKVTRLDIAIDVFDDPVTMDAVWERIQRGEYASKLRVWEREKDNTENGKDIIRGGGKDATRSIKIYNKAAEQKLEIRWTRYEITLMDARAREIWSKVRLLSDDAALLVFAKEVLATVVDFPEWAEWQSAFGVTSVHEWTPIPRTEPDQWRWLLRQVAPAFLKANAEDGDWSLLEKFVEAVKREGGRKDASDL